MKRIIMHWTAGTYEVSQVARQHYHLILDGQGRVHQGNEAFLDNENTADGDYAAHTLHANVGAIGIAVACCAGATESPLRFGEYPPTHKQLNELIYQVAVLCVRFDIQCTRETVLTHGEVQEILGIHQRGKWDLNYLPGVDVPGGDYLRSRIKTTISVLQKK